MRIARTCALVAALVPGSAFAAVPTIQHVAISNPYIPANTMMFEARVRVRTRADDADHDARVGYASSGTDCSTGRWKMGPEQRFVTTNTLSWFLYNLQPGATYDYNSAASTTCTPSPRARS